MTDSFFCKISKQLFDFENGLKKASDGGTALLSALRTIYIESRQSLRVFWSERFSYISIA
ncbi:hypothetical protein HW35_09840 [Bacillus sp. X1(2014)]|nr:hypothetical protein HW35_09840 [Bacillus sp. X1(2014)]